MAADIFSQLDAVNLLKGRGILMIGDSNVRCMYRDLICLCEKGTITPAEDFRAYVSIKRKIGVKTMNVRKVKSDRSRSVRYKNKSRLARLCYGHLLALLSYQNRLGDFVSDACSRCKTSPNTSKGITEDHHSQPHMATMLHTS
ncbi:hypothetical protein SK128_024540 [Halocaridina rubra]|uniref:Uncharacterized protein n=1 Tax=Halocaridina rubra TaxID=373956 RepID=A0AAN8XAU5_HALRR